MLDTGRPDVNQFTNEIEEALSPIAGSQFLARYRTMERLLKSIKEMFSCGKVPCYVDCKHPEFCDELEKL